MRLLPRRLLLALGTPLMLTACANIGPPEPPSLDLPKPPSDLRALRKGDNVTLTWTVPTLTTDRQAAHSFGATRICRGLQAVMTRCTPVGEAAPGKAMRKSPEQKISASYTDVLPSAIEIDNPSSFLSYAVEVLNADGRSAGLSNQVRVSLARALPPPKDLNAHITAQGVVLDWTSAPLPASPPAVRFVYRVYRRQEGDPRKMLVSEAPAGIDRHLSLTDSNIEWQKTYEYHTEAVTLVAQEGKPEVQVEGDDSPEVKVFADDVFPPTVPAGLQAVFSGPGQQPFIDLVWAPDTDADLNGYNVYRHEEGTEPMKLNAEPTKTPAYRDGNVAAGKHYFYSVSAVDVRGNESQHSEEASETVP
jgi:hypothetical protein